MSDQNVSEQKLDAPAEIFSRANHRAHELGLNYAGAVTPTEAHQLAEAGAARIVDVPTPEEWREVGHVDGPALVVWPRSGGEEEVQAFLKKLRERFEPSAASPVPLPQRCAFAYAAHVAAAAGFRKAYSILEGFEAIPAPTMAGGREPCPGRSKGHRVNFQQLRSMREAVRRDFQQPEAAAALFTSQPRSTRQIRELEDELGIEIFERSGKRLTGLTAPGKRLLGTIERMLLDSENLKRTALEFASESEQAGARDHPHAGALCPARGRGGIHEILSAREPALAAKPTAAHRRAADQWRGRYRNRHRGARSPPRSSRPFPRIAGTIS